MLSVNKEFYIFLSNIPLFSICLLAFSNTSSMMMKLIVRWDILPCSLSFGESLELFTTQYEVSYGLFFSFADIFFEVEEVPLYC